MEHAMEHAMEHMMEDGPLSPPRLLHPSSVCVCVCVCVYCIIHQGMYLYTPLRYMFIYNVIYYIRVRLEWPQSVNLRMSKQSVNLRMSKVLPPSWGLGFS